MSQRLNKDHRVLWGAMLIGVAMIGIELAMLARYSWAEHLVARTECHYEGLSYSHGSVVSTPIGLHICALPSLTYPQWIPIQPTNPAYYGKYFCGGERLRGLLSHQNSGSS